LRIDAFATLGERIENVCFDDLMEARRWAASNADARVCIYARSAQKRRRMLWCCVKDKRSGRKLAAVERGNIIRH
jgi:hypothetical protein